MAAILESQRGSDNTRSGRVMKWGGGNHFNIMEPLNQLHIGQGQFTIFRSQRALGVFSS